MQYQITDHKEECTLGTSNFVLLTMSTTAIQYPAHSLVSFYERSHKSHNKKTNFRQGQGVQFSRKVYYRGFLPYATFGTWKKTALAKNRISKIFILCTQ